MVVGEEDADHRRHLELDRRPLPRLGAHGQRAARLRGESLQQREPDVAALGPALPLGGREAAAVVAHDQPRRPGAGRVTSTCTDAGLPWAWALRIASRATR